jgi:hypothetical protein
VAVVVWLFRRAVGAFAWWCRGGVAARRAVGASRMVAVVVTCPLVARVPTPKGMG